MAGMYPAGFGPAGLVPPYVGPAVLAPVLPRSVYYNPSTKQLQLVDAFGNAIDMHPVDQIVVIRLTTEQGASASVPALGQRIRARCAVAAPSKYQQIAQQEVTSELQDLIDAGDVRLVSVVQTKNSANGALAFVIAYRNLRNSDPMAESPPVTV